MKAKIISSRESTLSRTGTCPFIQLSRFYDGVPGTCLRTFVWTATVLRLSPTTANFHANDIVNSSTCTYYTNMQRPFQAFYSWFSQTSKFALRQRERAVRISFLTLRLTRFQFPPLPRAPFLFKTSTRLANSKQHFPCSRMSSLYRRTRLINYFLVLSKHFWVDDGTESPLCRHPRPKSRSSG